MASMRPWTYSWTGKALAAGLALAVNGCGTTDTYGCVDRVVYSAWGAPDDTYGFNTNPPVEGVMFWKPTMGIAVTNDPQANSDVANAVLVIARPLTPPEELRYQISFDAVLPLEPLPAKIPLNPDGASVLIPKGGGLHPTIVCKVPLMGAELSLVRASGAATLPLPENFERLYRGVVPELDTDCVKVPGFEFEFQLTKERLLEPTNFELCHK